MEVATSITEFRTETDQDPSNSNGSCVVTTSTASAVFRKIEFHPARKPFNGFSNGGSDFKIETLNPTSGTKRVLSSPTSVKKSEGSDLLEHGLDPDLTFTITFRKIGAGLQNLGNTCFLNSVLQCLTYTEPLAATLQNAGHQKYCHVSGFCALCAIQKHVRTARQATGRILAPKDLVSNLRCISRNFRNCRQEDAHEYMINLLECMHKCSLPSGVPSESSDAYRRSLVHKIFGGTLRSQVKCEQCSHCSNKYDPFLDLSLDISKADSLHRALQRFTAIELLDEGAKVYQCERCKHKVKARKQLTVSKAPYVLTVHLKRFEAHRSEKIDRKVQFTSAMDMQSFVSDPHEGNLKYTLYGVLVHYGRSIHSGHYACFVRTSSGMWYSLDDNRVFQVSEKTVFDQKAYMLFYVRDRKNAVPKNPVPLVMKNTSKESYATNRASMIVSSNIKDQVNGSVDALVTNGSAPLKSCDPSAPAVLTRKDLNAKETPISSVEAKELNKIENGSVALKTCDLAAPAVLVQKDLNSKETFQKEVPLPQANGERSFVKEDSKAVCPILPGKVSPVLDGSTNAQTLVNSPASGAKAQNSFEETNSVNNLNEPANSLKVKHVSTGNSPIEETVLIDHAMGQQPTEQSASSIESIKPTSERETLNTPKKSRKHNMKTVYLGLNFFKLHLGSKKPKKRRRGKLSSTIAAKNISEELLSKKKTTDHEQSTSQTVSEVPPDLCEANKNAKRKRESSILLQKEAVSILTRGVPETVVAKWDEAFSASTVIGPKSEGTSIGYVADEWDEEYDRGKKKKIRIKEESYGGSNPFQMLATKRLKETKKKLTQRITSAKTAFRI